MWQCCECQHVVDSRPVAVQRWRKLSNQTPSVIVVHWKGRLALNVGDIFRLGVILARPYQSSIQEHAKTIKILQSMFKSWQWKLTVVRWLCVFVVVVFEYFVVEAEQVDGDRVLTGVVLLDCRQERLREVEPRDPEHARRSVLKPVLAHHTKSNQTKSNMDFYLERICNVSTALE